MTLASKLGDASWLLEVAVPFLYEFEWTDGQSLCEWRELEREVCGWAARPRLHEVRNSVSNLLGFSFSAGGRDSPPLILSEWSKVAESLDAKAVAKFVKERASSLESLAVEHKKVAEARGLPDAPVKFTPMGFLSMAKRRAVEPRCFEFFTQSYALVLFFTSKQSSIPSLVSALNCWGDFCDAVGASHFPVSPL